MKPRSNNLKKIMKKDPSQPTIGLTRHKNKWKKHGNQLKNQILKDKI
jgi:hypothetical protein